MPSIHFLDIQLYLLGSLASTMGALNQMVITSMLFFALILSRVDKFSASHVLVGSVACLDCVDHQNDYGLSGIKVQVKCDHVKKLSTTTTEQDGSFKIDGLPQDDPSSINCIAKIIGGPNQLYISRRNQNSKIVKVLGDDKHYYYTLSKPLNFYKSNPYEQNSNTKNIIGGKNSQFGSSKTFDVPVPSEWGIAPTSYYFPFVPIIGIP